MSIVFGHMIQELSSDAFKDTEFEKITQQEFDIFLKEFVFEKLKGKKLGQSFAEKFNVKDRVLYMFSHDNDAIEHIKYCKYIK